MLPLNLKVDLDMGRDGLFDERVMNMVIILVSDVFVSRPRSSRNDNLNLNTRNCRRQDSVRIL